MKKMYKNTPLYEAMKYYIEKDFYNFHTPAHCQGKWLSEKNRELLGKKLFEADLTELFGLDNLSCPKDTIKESENLAARTFNSDYTKYLVNGASAGVIAAILATVKEGEKVLVPRNAHKSLYNGFMLSGAQPFYIPLEKQDYFRNIDENVLENLLNAHPEAVLFLTNPNYFGDCLNLGNIRGKGGKNRTIIVDEAHGAHLSFCKHLPSGACEEEMDIWIQSTHKNMGSLTQSAMLHWREKNIDSFKILQMLQLIQTTSPSYPLLLSLELARENLENNKHLWDDLIKRVKYYRSKLKNIPGIKLYGNDPGASNTSYHFDATKLTLLTDELSLTGYEMAEILRRDYNILVELSGIDHVLFYLTPAHDKKIFDHLIYALGDISKKYLTNQKPNKDSNYLPSIPETAITPGKTIGMKYRTLNIKEAAGMISASFVLSFPPGIPLLVPGEVISEEISEYIAEITLNNEVFFEGLEELKEGKKGIKIIEE